MNFRLFLTMGILLSLFAAPAGAADGFNPEAMARFSADFRYNAAKGSMSGKYYRDGTKMRIEPNMADMAGKQAGGMTGMAMIVDLETKQVLSIMPQQKMYMVMPMGSPMARVPENPADSMSGVVSRKTVGSETVSGYKTTVEEIVVKSSDGKGTHTMKVWSAPELQGFPVQIQVKQPQAVTFTYSNIKVGSPDASLFQPPAGYQKMEMPQMPPGAYPGMAPGAYPGMTPGGQPH